MAEAGITSRMGSTYTKDQMRILFIGWGMTEFIPPTKKNAVVLATPAAKWDIQGFRSIKVTLSEYKSTYGKTLYQVEYLT